MKKLINKETKGITLIALVITIVILIILAGVLVNLTLGENGLFTRTKLAKQRYEYAAAKEIVDIKLADIKAECMTKGEEYTLDIIADRIGDDNEISTDIIHFYATAKNKSNQSKPSAIRGMLVSANKYPQFKFLIGKEGNVVKVLGITTGNIPTEWPENGLPEGIKTIEKFEEEIGANVVDGASGGGQTGGDEEILENQPVLQESYYDCTITISNNGVLNVSGITDLSKCLIVSDNSVYDIVETNEYFLGNLGENKQHKVYVIAVDNDAKIYKSNVLNYLPNETNEFEIEEEFKTDTEKITEQAYADGDNTHDLNLPKGKYLVKFSFNTESQIKEFVVDGQAVTEIDTNVYYITTETSTQVKWYSNHRGKQKFIYVEYKDITQSSINATVSPNSEVTSKKITYNNCTATLLNRQVTISGINNLEILFVCADDEYLYSTTDSIFTPNKLGEATYYAIGIDSDLNIYKTNSITYTFSDPYTIAQTIPIMSSSSQDGYEITSSKCYENNQTWGGWKAFDKDLTTSYTFYPVTSPGWVQIKFPKTVSVLKCVRQGYGKKTANCKLLYSNNGIDWNSATGDDYTSLDKNFTIFTNGYYFAQYWRFETTGKNQYYDLQMYFIEN